MLFAHSDWLWLLVLAPALALLDFRGGGSRRLSAALLRVACAAAIVAAISHPLLPWDDDTITTVAVVDIGQGITVASLARARSFVAHPPAGRTLVVAYAARAAELTGAKLPTDDVELAALKNRLAKPLWADDAEAGGANLADALRFAGTLIPAGGRGQIRLFASGRNDHGDAAAESWRLARRAIAVAAEAEEFVPAVALRIRSVDAPGTARLGQTIRVRLMLESAFPAEASVRLTAGDAKPIDVVKPVVAGANLLTVDVPFDKGGLIPIHVRAALNDVPSSSVVESTQAVVFVGAPLKLLLVENWAEGTGSGFSEAVSSLLGPVAAIRTVSPAGLLKQDIVAADVIVLADVPADRLSSEAQHSIEQAVTRGTGLLVTGASHSFGPGGYGDSQLAEILPVKMAQQIENVDPSTTLVLVIDTSASMQGDRLDLAKEIARLALSHLKPHDKAGIVEFYGGKRWAAPIQSAGNRSVLHRALDRLTAGGTTQLFPAVEEAAFALHNVQTRSKHVLICSDGFVEDAPFSSLVRQMADDGVVVSTAQVTAPDGQSNQMSDIARWGKGRYYVVPDPFAIPDLSLKQAKVSLTSPLVRTKSAVSAGSDPLVKAVIGDVSDMGTVGGYVRTQARPTADVLLTAGRADPLLARWRYGAGYVAALPTQLGSVMGLGLQDKPSFAALLAGLIRQIGDNRGSAVHITTDVRPGGIEVDVTALDGEPASATLRLSLADPGGRLVRSVSEEAIAPGHWNFWLPDVTAGTYALTASVDETTSSTAGLGVPAPSERVAADADQLQQVGAFGPLAAERAAALPGVRPSWFDAQKFLSALAAVFLLAQVAVRRWPAGGTQASTASIV